MGFSFAKSEMLVLSGIVKSNYVNDFGIKRIYFGHASRIISELIVEGSLL